MTQQTTEETPPAAPQPPPYYAPPVRQLTRSIDDKMIAGVCGGLARHLNVDPTLVRVLTAVALVAAFPAVLVGYVVAWAIVPRA